MIFAGARFATVSFAGKLNQLETTLPPEDGGDGTPPGGDGSSTPPGGGGGSHPGGGQPSLPDDVLTLPAIPQDRIYLDLRKRPEELKSNNFRVEE